MLVSNCRWRTTYADLERNFCCRVIRHDLGNLPHIPISILALVRAKAPIWHHGGKTRKSRVLDSDFLGRRTSKEVEIYNTSQGVVFEILALGIIDLDIHTLRASKEDTVGAVLSPVVEIDRVRTIKVGS